MSFISSFLARTRAMPLQLIALLTSALLAADPATVHAVDGRVANKPARPRICLVLSGGGARGAAHVGVLKVLEEMRIPIDCIAGTSMGSIVGGSYAAGASIAEMEQQLKSITSETLFKDKPPRQDVPIHRKQDDQTLYFSPELGVRDGKILLPKGIVSGIVLEAELRKLAKTPGYINFDELPIPFRAVATDIASGQMVVFRDGELASVMRASMSVPAAMDPVEIDGKLLVDGGLARNLPVDVARAMGGRHRHRGQPRYPAAAARGDHIGVRGHAADDQHPDGTKRAGLAGIAGAEGHSHCTRTGRFFSATDFDHLGLTVPIGEAAARKVAAQLAPYSLSVEDYAELQADKVTLAPPDLRPVHKIRVDGLQRMNPAVVEATMETKVGVAIEHKPWIATSAASTAAAISSTSTTASAPMKTASGCWRSRPARNPGARVTCASASGSPAISAAMRFFQPARQLSQDLAQFTRRRMAHRPAGRPQQPADHRIAPAAR
ncbi:patatin-like phospholipase family protein [Undibacterium arcticum]